MPASHGETASDIYKSQTADGDTVACYTVDRR